MVSLVRIHTTLLAFASLAGVGYGKLTCVGENGAAVDWWLALKSPGTDRLGNTKYGYVDSTSKRKDGAYVWLEGTQINGTTDNPAANTLAPLYSSTSGVGYVMWNDEPGTSHCPKGCTSFNLAHAKGVIGASSQGGFWLSHSIPKYPDSPADAAFGGIKLGQTLNGQHLLCISLSPGGLESVAGLLQLANLYTYSPKNLTASLHSMYPNLTRLAGGPSTKVSSTAKTGAVAVATAGGEKLTILAKSSTGEDGQEVRMWEDVVEPKLRSPMLVQTWPEGVAKDFPSYCGPPQSPFASLTITNVTLPGTPLSWITRGVGSYHDHSKWGVTAPATADGVFCAGDNNRAVHQNVRGGSAICFTANNALHASVARSVAATTPCQSGSPGPSPDSGRASS